MIAGRATDNSGAPAEVFRSDGEWREKLGNQSLTTRVAGGALCAQQV